MGQTVKNQYMYTKELNILLYRSYDYWDYSYTTGGLGFDKCFCHGILFFMTLFCSNSWMLIYNQSDNPYSPKTSTVKWSHVYMYIYPK